MKNLRCTELYGLCTDKTRKQLNASWNRDPMLDWWQDPVSGRWFAEPQATAIMLKRIQNFTSPELGIPALFAQRGKSMPKHHRFQRSKS